MLKIMLSFVPIHIFLWSLFCFFMIVYGAELGDINCLREINNSSDSSNQIWDFNFNINTIDLCSSFTGIECMTSGIDEEKVISIKLSNMGLEGQFPHCIENFSWLQNLNLSHNKLFGNIPPDISSKLPYLTSLDLSNNNFYGEIPKAIANLSYLNTLRLDGNQLNGTIPKELGFLPRITVFSVANNLLSGPVPVFVNNNVNVTLSYVNNNGLCGGTTLESCDEESLFGKPFWYSFVIAFVCSATSVIVTFMDYTQPWNEFKKSSRKSNTIYPLRKEQNNQKHTTNVAQLLPLALQEEGNKELCRLLERLIPRMSFMELCKATNYFSSNNIMGLGTTGIMYKAEVSNNCLIAVKRFYYSDKYKRQFLLETMIPGRHMHRNIASLLGFCIEKKERILVYSYISNGTLCHWLHNSQLEWPERIHIAIGIARGLSWLHKKCKIIHLNLSSECVLLDKNFEPKISNFGKAKFIMNQKNHARMRLFLVDEVIGVKGSFEKDIYDFGIILFELITGQKLSISSDSCSTNYDDDIGVDNSSLRSYISNRLFTDPSDFYYATDKCITGKGFDDKIHGLLEVACKCVKPSMEQRPKMDDVYRTITALWKG
ncbi:hypothetical protein HN51_030527 [Arachis hypogaea]|uniref:Protein kinase domain-containing protein n=1 Tax=Arachis hypogaea TaxID=3818 RepID=A0A445BAZ9_ARAHY|nr:hypothetical protein Ahy_A10g050925 [Arachis hypogaea]